MPDPRFILFSSSMGSMDCIAWLCLYVVPDRILGECVLEDLMESTDYEDGNDWNL